MQDKRKQKIHAKGKKQHSVRPSGAHKKVDDILYVYGKHVVDLALEHYPFALKTIWVSPEFSDAKLLAKVRRSGREVEVLHERTLPGGLSRDTNHQGIVATVLLLDVVWSYASYLQQTTIGSESCFLVLSEVQDPQNVGAMIRSAAAFGVQAVLLPKHRQAPLTGAVAKVSAGMVFTTPLVSIGNLNTTLEDLQARGVSVYGLTGYEGDSIYTHDLTGPCAFVVGNEATGLRQQTKAVCDALLTIPMHPRCESLNANASVVASLTARAQQRSAVQ